MDSGYVLLDCITPLNPPLVRGEIDPLPLTRGGLGWGEFLLEALLLLAFARVRAGDRLYKAGLRQSQGQA